MPKGTIRWYDPDRGQGYIDLDAGGPPVFVHRDDLTPECGGRLHEEQAVTFEIATTPTGEVAREVRPASDTV